MITENCYNWPLVEALRRGLKKAGSQKEFARRLGVSPQHLSDVLKGRREFSATVLRKLGVRRLVCYVTLGEMDGLRRGDA